jgi:hypothetical protein
MDDSDSEFPPLSPIAPLIKYTTRSSLAASGLPDGGTNTVAGPSFIHHSQSNDTQGTTGNGHGVEVIEIKGTSFCFCSLTIVKYIKFRFRIVTFP